MMKDKFSKWLAALKTFEPNIGALQWNHDRLLEFNQDLLIFVWVGGKDGFWAEVNLAGLLVVGTFHKGKIATWNFGTAPLNISARFDYGSPALCASNLRAGGLLSLADAIEQEIAAIAKVAALCDARAPAQGT